MTDVVGWWCGVLAMEIVNYRAGLIIGTALQISVWQFSRTFDFQSTNDKRMLTKYFAKVSVKFNPTHRSGMLNRKGTVQLAPASCLLAVVCRQDWVEDSSNISSAGTNVSSIYSSKCPRRCPGVAKGIE